MSFLANLLKRGDKTDDTDGTIPPIFENGDAVGETTPNDQQQATSESPGTTPTRNQSLMSPVTGVSSSLVSTLRKISSGGMMTELHAGESPGQRVDEAAHRKPQTPVASVNVVVVGAGLAGLSAAYHLRTANQGISVMILEASKRVGGRTLSRDLESSSGRDFWDFGAQWISGSQLNMLQLTDKLELQMYTQPDNGSHLAYFEDGRKVQFDGQVHPLSSITRLDYSTFISKMEKLRLEVSLEAPDECPMAAEWDSITLEQFRKQHLWTTAAQQYFDAQVRVLFGVPPSQMSTLFFLFMLNSAGGWQSLFEMGSETAKEFRIKGGSQRVCEIMADTVNRDYLQLGDPVVSIDQHDCEMISVQTLSGKRFRCDRVVVALPPKFVARINFSPPMPSLRDGLLQRMPSGNSLRFVVTYSEAFWHKNGFSGYVLPVTSPMTSRGPGEDNDAARAPFLVIADATTMDQSPALTGTVVDSKIREMPVEERKMAILKGIELFFGVEALQPLDYSEMDWADEPYCSAFPSCVMAPGTLTRYFQALKKPFKRVHWAGPETTIRWFGFMDGAVHSGKRAAQEVMGELRPEIVVGV